MDGPNSNLKFLSQMKKLRIEDELASLIDIGSCNLHVIDGAFKPAPKVLVGICVHATT